MLKHISDSEAPFQAQPDWAKTQDRIGEGNYVPQGGAWMRNMIGLLDVARRQLARNREAAQSAIEQATSLLQQQMGTRPTEKMRVSGGLLVWQVQKVRDYVDEKIAGRVLVAELSAIAQLSDAHFSRSFKSTFGMSPHSYVLRRRVEVAAELMLWSSAPLIDIAVRCGFADQAHFCHKFRKAIGESPAAWRRRRKDPNVRKKDFAARASVFRGPNCGNWI
jgi:transcriptional regulator GlxA family with amidase domain